MKASGGGRGAADAGADAGSDGDADADAEADADAGDDASKCRDAVRVVLLLVSDATSRRSRSSSPPAA